MTRIASRTDLHYVLAFLAGIVVTFVGSAAVGSLVALIPLPYTGALAELQAFSQTVNAVTLAGILLVYGAGFLALAWLLRRIGGRPRPAGMRLAIVTVVCLLAALMLSTVNAVTFVNAPLGDSSVWVDLLAVTSCGAFYSGGWFLAITFGKSPKKGRLL
jgi:cytochrome bd-type quinol oxidase subunit 2